MKIDYRIFDHSPTTRLWVIHDVTHLQNLKRILDVGCGTGDEILRRNFGAELVGLDISRHKCRKAKTRTKTEIICADGQFLPFISEVFDGVLCNQVIEHVKDDKSLLSEIYTVLKEKGKLVISTAKYSSTRRFILRNYGIDRAFKGKFLDIGHEREYSYKKFSEIVKSSGFNILSFRGCEIGFIFGYIDSAVWALAWKLRLTKQAERILRLLYRLDNLPLPLWQTFSLVCSKQR
ncbi:MAG: class I SAM-dependent methyltransferase [Candidatus Bathyarchaeia archaeon]